MIAKAKEEAAAEVPHFPSGTRVVEAFAVDDDVVQKHLRDTTGSKVGRWGTETFLTADEQWYARIGPHIIAAHLVDYECYVIVDRSECKSLLFLTRSLSLSVCQ